MDFEWTWQTSQSKLTVSLTAVEILTMVLIIVFFNLPRIVKTITWTYQLLIYIRRKTLRSSTLQGQSQLNRSEEKHKSNNGFYFSPLDALDKEIRLLRLHRGDKNDPIEIELTHASLHDRPRYLALSYVWGDTTTLYPVSVNRQRLSITLNLLHALEHIRNTKGTDNGMLYWVDGICIDQNNVSERNHQVRLMTEIYSSAFKVLVWLGVPTEDSELALAKMKAMDAWMHLKLAPKRTEDTKQIDDPKTQSESAWHRHLGGDLHFLIGDPTQSGEEYLEPWEALIRFLQNPWFSRAWIAQEVSSPTSDFIPSGNVEMIMGRSLQTIPFRSTIIQLPFIVHLIYSRDAIDLWPKVADMVKRADKGCNGIRRLSSISSLRKRRFLSPRIIGAFSRVLGSSFPGLFMTTEQHLWRTRVHPMLDNFRGLGCLDPRDKVYAAFCLVLPSSHPAFRPDYGVPLEQVYGQVVQSFLRYEQSLNILAGRSGSDPNMPSWVPDWRGGTEAKALCTRLDYHNQPLYNAASGTLPETSIRIRSEHSENLTKDPILNSLDGPYSHRDILKARGVILDTVSQIGLVCPDPHELHRPNWEELLKSLPEHYTPTNESVYHAYQRTLMGDIYGSGLYDDSGPKSTWLQTISTWSEILERGFRNWIWQPSKEIHLHNVMQMIDNRGGAVKRRAWKRGAEIDRSFQARLTCTSPPRSAATVIENITAADDDVKQPLEYRLRDTAAGRVFCTTTAGYMGLVPEQAQTEDVIVVLFGGSSPFILRLREGAHGGTPQEREWQLIGECYIHGIMDGEAMKASDLDGVEDVNCEDFVLV
ncbi:hypothetical protein MMC27_004889 [Xylographa pallens]|nr:hypothetical protein [Xylographa pallens]